jgi:hypothetical protein
VPIGAAVLAFVASQHHNIHMLAIALGLGGAGASFMQSYPAIRRVMLLVSIGMVVFTLISLRRRPVSPGMRVWVVLFSILTIGIVVWSVARFGV